MIVEASDTASDRDKRIAFKDMHSIPEDQMKSCKEGVFICVSKAVISAVSFDMRLRIKAKLFIAGQRLKRYEVSKKDDSGQKKECVLHKFIINYYYKINIIISGI
jgi:hypothetical protein